MNRNIRNSQRLSSLIFFIFGGAIVGETLAISLVVSVAGAGILSNLYLINGVLLFFLPFLILKKIDRQNRGKILSNTLLNSSFFLIIFSVLIIFDSDSNSIYHKYLLYTIYPISYIIKTLVFLAFWTLATDLVPPSETKKRFPTIAAWGFAGGLFGALCSQLFLKFIDVPMLIVVWAFFYIMAYLILREIRNTNADKLSKQEEGSSLAKLDVSIIENIKNIYNIELVRLISILYFLIFVGIFLIDFLFWNICSNWFDTTSNLASFQFSFYLTYGLITVLGLLFLTPYIISKVGFTRMFSFLPIILLIGPLLLFLGTIVGFSEKNLFLLYILVQFFRYITFENAFSPIYQMFFASISRDKRGRAKTVIEGFVKPFAIIFAGLLLMLFGTNVLLILLFLIVIALFMLFIVKLISYSYLKILVPGEKIEKGTEKLIADIGSNYDQKVLKVLKEYSMSDDTDIRLLAAQILAKLGNRQAFLILSEIFNNSKETLIQEMIAVSLEKFNWYEVKQFVEELLCNRNNRVVGNAIFSLNRMSCHWKWRLIPRIRELLFSGSLRTKIEAATFLWFSNEKSEKGSVIAFVNTLHDSTNSDERAGGVYLVSQLKINDWETILEDSLMDKSFSVFERGIEQILLLASPQYKILALKIVEKKSRKHIEITGRFIRKIGEDSIPVVVSFIKNVTEKRMTFELIYSLRVIREKSGKSIPIDRNSKEKLMAIVGLEIRNFYYAVNVWVYGLVNISSNDNGNIIFTYAMREQLYRVGGWVLDTMAILEPGSVIAMGRKDLDIRNYSDRQDLVEIVKSFGIGQLKSQVIPLLENSSWFKIAKSGKLLFHFRINDRERYRYFMTYENKWITLTTLYCLYNDKNKNSLIENNRKLLLRVAQEATSYVKYAAEKLLNPEMESRKLNSFKLLETVLFYKKITLFESVPAERLMGLAEISKLEYYKKGEKISSQGDLSAHMYIIKEGSVRVVKNKNGVEVALANLRNGDTYGEIGLFNQAPRSASAMANIDSAIFVIQRDALKKLLLEIPEIAINFLKSFGAKLKNNGEEIALLNATLTNSNKTR